MKVKRKQLKEGCILSADILLFSPQPIMRKKTVLTKELLDVLEIFLIQDIQVEEKLVTGEAYIPTQLLDDEVEEVKEVGKLDEKSFINLYLEAVKKYKKAFERWDSGYKVDILEIRNMFLPLFEKIIDDAGSILSIHHYTKKEDYIFHHAVSVAVLSAFLGKKLNFSKGEWIQIGLAGAMADSGMSKIEKKNYYEKRSVNS
jgi:HD-GYP domain-containing protein (c-di-GMP phosphodiesterase class II)